MAEIELKEEIQNNDEKFVSLKNVNKYYNKTVHAVTDFNLDIKKHEFIVFVGPSGCGKSTTLRMIAGLEEISSGELYIDGVYSNKLSPKDRDIAMVFQSYALYPNMTVAENIGFGLKVRHFDKKEIAERVKKAAEILEISDLLNRKPKALSGGQRQRVALGRAIVRDARLFLMDEPLSNLDAKLRVQMRSEITRLHHKINATTIYVTHDQVEAMTMADRIVVMKDGITQQIDTPIEIYRHPANKFVASFIGSPAMNFIAGNYDNGRIEFINGEHIKLSNELIKKHDEFYQNQYNKEKLGLEQFIDKRKQEYNFLNEKNKKAVPYDESTDKEVEYKKQLIQYYEDICINKKHPITFGIRPEHIIQTTKSNKKAIKIEVTLSELLGDEFYVHFNYGGNDVLSKVSSEQLIDEGQIMYFEISESKIHLFDEKTSITII